jgi:hypothetical protein
MMPKQNPLTRLDAVAAGLGRMADGLHTIYGEPTPNLLYWRNEIVEAIEELSASGQASADAEQPEE